VPVITHGATPFDSLNGYVRRIHVAIMKRLLHADVNSNFETRSRLDGVTSG
jgi:hypothetical protein